MSDHTPTEPLSICIGRLTRSQTAGTAFSHQSPPGLGWGGGQSFSPLWPSDAHSSVWLLGLHCNTDESLLYSVKHAEAIVVVWCHIKPGVKKTKPIKLWTDLFLKDRKQKDINKVRKSYFTVPHLLRHWRRMIFPSTKYNWVLNLFQGTWLDLSKRFFCKVSMSRCAIFVRGSELQWNWIF